MSKTRIGKFAFRCIPESPRWLIAVGRTEEALAILKKAAMVNKKDKDNVDLLCTHLSNSVTADYQKPSFGSLFSTPPLMKRSILLIINW